MMHLYIWEKKNNLFVEADELCIISLSLPFNLRSSFIKILN